MSPRNLALIPLCVAINVVIGSLVHLSKLPIYYDAVGTIVATIMIGFLAGALVGALSFALMALLVSPVYLYFIGTQIAISAYIWLVATHFSGLKTVPRTVMTGIGLGIVAGIVSAPIIVYAFGGAAGSGRDLLTAIIAASGQQILKSVALSGLASEPIDKTIQVLTAVFLIRGLPKTLLGRFEAPSLKTNF